MWLDGEVVAESTAPYNDDSFILDGSTLENGTYDASYAGVWHLHADTKDSTSNSNDAADKGSKAATGQIIFW